MLYSVGPWEFPTKQAAMAYTRALLHEPPLSTPIINQGDEFLRSLINQHPEADVKIGAGINHFTVETEGPWGTRHFVLHRRDRTSTDFSFRSCFQAPTHRSQVYAALRAAVADQVLAFRDRMCRRGVPIICALSGAPLPPDQVHVDHIYPFTFSAMVESWLQEAGLVVNDLHLQPSQDHQQICQLVNENLSTAFAEYHRRHARYRLLDRRVNMHLSNQAGIFYSTNQVKEIYAHANND